MIDIDDIRTWPCNVIDCLATNQNIFSDWTNDASRSLAQNYDLAIYSLISSLKSHSIRGWHCTRLTDWEIQDILENGMHLPDLLKLQTRVARVVELGLVTSEISEILICENQANDENRRHKLWFCFYPPSRAGESGISRFFRHWGGEALYNSHERNPVVSDALRRIGNPAVVEAEVPVNALGFLSQLATVLYSRFLETNGEKIRETVEFESFSTVPIPPKSIRKIVLFGDSAFQKLTNVDGWTNPPSNVFL